MIFWELHAFRRIVCFPKLAAILKNFFWGNSDISLGIFTQSCDSYLILWCKLNLYIPISISALFLAALRACLRRSSSFLWDSDILAGSKNGRRMRNRTIYTHAQRESYGCETRGETRNSIQLWRLLRDYFICHKIGKYEILVQTRKSA